MREVQCSSHDALLLSFDSMNPEAPETMGQRLSPASRWAAAVVGPMMELSHRRALPVRAEVRAGRRNGVTCRRNRHPALSPNF